MQISARNQIKVTITEIEVGAVNSVLLLSTEQGLHLSSSITNHSVQAMNLQVSQEVVCFFKASNVLIATGNLESISARNKIAGTIKNIEPGAVNSEVLLETESKDIITAIITNDAIEELGLQGAEKAVAIIKANEIMIAK